jgi:hypothetical protein
MLKYYLDSSAAINLVNNGFSNYKHFKNTYVPKLLVDEWTKNLEKHYSRQRKQFLYLKENGINIDWRFCETLLFLKPFGFFEEYSIKGPKMCYDSIMKFENYDDYIKDGKSDDKTHHFIMEVIDQMRENIHRNYFEGIFFDLKYLKDNYNAKKPYLTKKYLLENYLNTGISILKDYGKVNSKVEKEIFMKRGKKAYHQLNEVLDYYINVTIELLKDNNKDLERNDASDLYYLLYLDRSNGDTFVTDDGGIRNLCNLIEKDSAISLDEYLSS